jgi:hydroxymethylbilane synthase
MHDRPILIATRGSALALAQARTVLAQCRSAFPEEGFDLQIIKTTGDKLLTASLASPDLPKGLFTKELEAALLSGEADLAVHSLKDLPTDTIDGLALAAVPPRERVGDALVSNKVTEFQSLGPGARVGTGSTRRRAQRLHVRPDLQVLDIRGNVDTRLRKLDEGQYDAVILAEAGLRRLGFTARIAQVIPRSILVPAVGQGALGIETRSDAALLRALAPLEHAETRAAVTGERAMLAALRGGCLAPVAAWGRVAGGELMLDAVVLDVSGTRALTAARRGAPVQAEAIGRAVAEELLAAGAAELIAAARELRA